MSTAHELHRHSAASATRAGRAANLNFEALSGCLDGLGFDGQRPQAIGFVSPSPRAGVSTIASNFAVELAQRGSERVLLIDAHLEHPTLHRHFAVRTEPGLVQALASDLSVEECIQRTDIEMLSLLASGTSGRDAAVGMRAQEFGAALREMRNDFDSIVVDLPPAGDLSSSYTVAALLDGVVMVIEPGRESAEKLARVKRKFVQANAKLFGVVLNKCRKS
jgi:capsular exopolysaccharide synthesis family protein